METKHTPGPWRIGGKQGQLIYGPRQGRKSPIIAEVSGTARGGKLFYNTTTKANAVAIALVPELLEACEAVLLWAKTPGDHGGNPHCKDFVRKAGKVVEKATGKEY